MNDQIPPNDPDPDTGEIIQGQLMPPVAMPVEASLAVALQRAEVDQAIMTARAFKRDVDEAKNSMKSWASENLEIAELCIYSVPRAGKMLRGPSVRFAELVRSAWGNCRSGARPLFVDRLEEVVEVEAQFVDLQTNITTVARQRRKIEKRKNRKTLDADMIQLAANAGMSIAKRNAILDGIPRPMWLPAYQAAEALVRGDIKSLEERRGKAFGYFFQQGVTPEKLWKALGVTGPSEVTLDHLMTMTGWKTALTEKDVTLEQIFPEEASPEPKRDLGQRIDALAERSMLQSDRRPAASEPPSPARDTGIAPVQNEERPVQEVAAGVTPMAPEAATSAHPPDYVADRFYREPMPPPPPEPAGPVYAPDPQHPQHVPQEAPQMAQEPPPPPPPPKPASKRQTKATGLARLSELAAEGDKMAVEGIDALNQWLEGLDANDQQLITIGMMKRWQDAASK